MQRTTCNVQPHGMRMHTQPHSVLEATVGTACKAVDPTCCRIPLTPYDRCSQYAPNTLHAPHSKALPRRLAEGQNSSSEGRMRDWSSKRCYRARPPTNWASFPTAARHCRHGLDSDEAQQSLSHQSPHRFAARSLARPCIWPYEGGRTPLAHAAWRRATGRRRRRPPCPVRCNAVKGRG